MIEIKSCLTGAVIIRDEKATTVKEAVVAAVEKAKAEGARANLADANLADANLADANLADANLAGANLARANLADADLARANLAHANLADANLAGANLAGADLAHADLAGAYLAHAYLADAYLARANLAGANLAGANLADANLADADLADADLADAYLAHAYLARAYLARANLARANLAGANLAGADRLIWEKDEDGYAQLKEGATSPGPRPDVPAGEPHRRRTLAERAAEYRARHPEVPVVPNLDAKILEVIESGTGKLNMSDWHTCETTHCRAGWAIHLAGKAGYELEQKLGDAARAGRAIYRASTGRSPYFFDTNDRALADIKRCAKEDAAATESGESAS